MLHYLNRIVLNEFYVAEIDYIGLTGWEDVDASCQVTQTYEHAILTCPTRLEVRRTTSPDSAITVLEEGDTDVERWTYPASSGSTNAYTIVRPEPREFHVYELDITGQSEGQVEGEVDPVRGASYTRIGKLVMTNDYEITDFYLDKTARYGVFLMDSYYVVIFEFDTGAQWDKTTGSVNGFESSILGDWASKNGQEAAGIASHYFDMDERTLTVIDFN